MTVRKRCFTTTISISFAALITLSALPLSRPVFDTSGAPPPEKKYRAHLAEVRSLFAITSPFVHSVQRLYPSLRTSARCARYFQTLSQRIRLLSWCDNGLAKIPANV